jgi:hypothetical protein
MWNPFEIILTFIAELYAGWSPFIWEMLEILLGLPFTNVVMIILELLIALPFMLIYLLTGLFPL